MSQSEVGRGTKYSSGGERTGPSQMAREVSDGAGAVGPPPAIGTATATAGVTATAPETLLSPSATTLPISIPAPNASDCSRLMGRRSVTDCSEAPVEGRTAVVEVGFQPGTVASVSNSNGYEEEEESSPAPLAAPAAVAAEPTSAVVARIPVESDTGDDDEVKDDDDDDLDARDTGASAKPSAVNHGDASDDEDEDYEYVYDDEDDDPHYCSGFLISPSDHLTASTSSSSSRAVGSAATPMAATIRADSEEGARNKVPSEASASVSRDETTAASLSAISSSVVGDASTLRLQSKASESAAASASGRWREPSREAVSMSLRAEKEKTGGKRRLAADLYRIMTTDTAEAGFSIAPKSEDSMDRWIIRLFKFDEESHLHRDLVTLGLDHVELEMSFPDQYPFEPPFVRVVRPRFKRQTGFVMNGALCMELLTKEGWNPVNDIESVIVSIRSLLVVGEGRLQAVADMSDKEREEAFARAQQQRQRHDELDVAMGEESKPTSSSSPSSSSSSSRKRHRSGDDNEEDENRKAGKTSGDKVSSKKLQSLAGSYTTAEAREAYSHLSDYHKRKGWDTNGWWAKKG